MAIDLISPVMVPQSVIRKQLADLDSFTREVVALRALAHEVIKVAEGECGMMGEVRVLGEQARAALTIEPVFRTRRNG